MPELNDSPPRAPERRRQIDRRRAPSHDLYQRLEAKRAAIDVERRANARRQDDRRAAADPPDGITPDDIPDDTAVTLVARHF